MIKLTNKFGNPVYVNPELIKFFDSNRINPSETDITYFNSPDGFLLVTESPEQVARLITEYKQRQMRLQAAYNGWYENMVIKSDIAKDISSLESEDRGE